jgi:hypothetical protein
MIAITKSNKRYLTTGINLGGGARLGNYLYAFASTYGIAKQFQRIVYVQTTRLFF